MWNTPKAHKENIKIAAAATATAGHALVQGIEKEELF
jgi:hypothetical protein